MDTHTHDIRMSQWTSIIQKCNTSGMTKKQWCQDNNIKEKQFYYWQRRIRKLFIQTAAGNVEPTAVTFAELPLMQETHLQPPKLACTSPQLKLNKGSLSIEISNLSGRELLDFTKELLLDA